jgi:hypothetical protein
MPNMAANAQGAGAKQGMELFAKDRDTDVAAQPRTGDRTKAQLFHAWAETISARRCASESLGTVLIDGAEAYLVVGATVVGGVGR